MGVLFILIVREAHLLTLKTMNHFADQSDKVLKVLLRDGNVILSENFSVSHLLSAKIRILDWILEVMSLIYNRK